MSKPIVAVMGSCRVHRPIAAIAKTGRCVYVPLGSSSYLHSAREALQRLRWTKGLVDLPASLSPYIFGRSPIPRGTEDHRAVLADASAAIVEIASDKDVGFEDVFLQINYMQSQFVAPLGEAGAQWWRAVTRGAPAGEALIEKIETSIEFTAAGFGEIERRMLRSVRLERAEAQPLADTIEALRRLWGRPLGVVTHIGATRADGKPLIRRLSFIDLLTQVCGSLGVPAFQPAQTIQCVGSRFALAKDGEDLEHFNPAFEPLYGWRILDELVRPMHEARFGALPLATSQETAS